MPNESKEEEKTEERETEAKESKEEEKTEERETEAKGISEGILEGLSRIRGAGARVKQSVFRNVSGIGIVLMLAIVLHFLDIIFGLIPSYLRIVLYAALSIISFFFLFWDFKTPLILFLIAYFWPLLAKIPIDFFSYFVIFVSPWVFFLTFSAPKEQVSGSFKAWQFIYTIILFAAVLIWISGFLREAGITPSGVAKELEKAVPQTVLEQTRETARELPRKIWELISGTKERFLREATGDYYTGEVEKNKQEPLGVYIENLELADPVFYEGQRATIWGIIKARTIGEEVDINTSCKADNKIRGKTSPENIKITTLEENDIMCNFESLSKGSHKIDVSADFNFKTMSYLKAYFMDRNRLHSMRLENIDPFEQYKIEDRDPVAVYTNGPIAIGMETTKPLPLGIDATTPGPLLGITLQNKWEGKIKEIERLIIYIPDGFIIDVDSPIERFPCDHLFENANLVQGDKDYQAGYNAYVLSDKDPVKKTIGNLQPGQWQSFKCRLNIFNADKIIGKTPFAIHNFKATIYYKYTTTKSISIEVKQSTFSLAPPPFKSPITKGNSEDIFKRIEKYKASIEATEGRSEDHELLAAIIAAESAGFPNAESKTGCLGLMQFCAQTAYEYGLCGDSACSSFDYRTNPERSIEAGSRYILVLKKKFDGYDDKERFAVASYNAGYGVVLRAIEKTGKEGDRNLKWEEVAEKIDVDLLEELPDYTGCWRTGCWDAATRLSKVNEIKNYVNIVESYKNDYKGRFA